LLCLVWRPCRARGRASNGREKQESGCERSEDGEGSESAWQARIPSTARQTAGYTAEFYLERHFGLTSRIGPWRPAAFGERPLLIRMGITREPWIPQGRRPAGDGSSCYASPGSATSLGPERYPLE
jgi:hypothetical protein